MRKYIFLLSVVFLMSVVGAASNLGTFKQDECVNLYQLCDNCTYVNLTSIKYPSPNYSIQKYDVAMTKEGVDYTYAFCSTSILGKYTYSVCGDKDNVFSCENIEFDITTTGGDMGFTLFLVLLIAAAILFILAYVVDLDFMTFFSGILFLLSGVYSMIYGVGNLADLYTRGIAGVCLGIGLVLILASIHNLSKEGGEE